MRILVVMDPVETVKPNGDTSFALMLEAQKRGHTLAHALISNLELKAGEAWVRSRKAVVSRDAAQPIHLAASQDEPIDTFDAVLIRKDPPFDEVYWWATLILDRVQKAVVFNGPRGLRNANEKLYTCQFASLMPKTIVSSHEDVIEAFVREVGGYAVIKPIGGKAGEGIMALRKDDLNFWSILETQTHNGRNIVMVQEYLPSSRVGDKRILLLDGEPLGLFLRVPRADDLRSNVRVGGEPNLVPLDDADKAIIKTIGPKLREDHLWFVGIDVIGGKLTEINVTSPTGIQQMSKLYGRALESDVIDSLERHVNG